MQSTAQAKSQGKNQTMIQTDKPIRAETCESGLKFYPLKLWITLLITSPLKGESDALLKLAKQCLKNRQNLNI